MATAAIKSPNEQKKLLAAVGLGVVAIILLWWTFFGFGSSAKPQTRNTARPATATPPTTTASQPQQAKPAAGADLNVMSPNDLNDITRISLPTRQPLVPEPHRNIFAFFVKPVVVVQPSIPVPSPTPTPPILLASVSPSNVYARTDDFTLEVTGDKFTPAARIVIDNRDLPTRYVSPQQLATTVPASMIANPGQRFISVKSNDATLYSNQVTLNVTPPPVPNYTFVGILGKPRHIGDTALLLDKSSKEILSVQRGDVLGGRFRITSISDRELVVVDTNLKIKHLLALTNEGEKGPFPQGRPTPRVASEDDEP
jgi:hypothetical protein